MLTILSSDIIQITTSGIIAVPDTIAIASTVILIAILAIRDFVGNYGDLRLRLLNRLLLIIAIPLLSLFAFIVVTRIIDSL